MSKRAISVIFATMIGLCTALAWAGPAELVRE